MRISAKRLRYTMDICRPAYDGRMAEAFETVKGLQTPLGEIHDSDVWADRLRAFLDSERERTRAYFGDVRPMKRLAVGIEYLAGERAEFRRRMFADLGAQWQALKDGGFWQHLRTLLDDRAGPAGLQEDGGE